MIVSLLYLMAGCFVGMLIKVNFDLRVAKQKKKMSNQYHRVNASIQDADHVLINLKKLNESISDKK